MLRIYVKFYFNTCLPFLAFRLYSIEPGNFLNDIPSLPLKFYYINKICIPIIFLDILEVFFINTAILYLKNCAILNLYGLLT